MGKNCSPLCTVFSKGNVGPSSLVLIETSQQLFTDIQGPQRMKSSHFNYPPTFHPAPPAGQNLHLSSDILREMAHTGKLNDFKGHK